MYKDMKKKCLECNGKKKVDWYYLDGTKVIEDCPRCHGMGKEPKIIFPYGDGDKKTFRRIT